MRIKRKIIAVSLLLGLSRPRLWRRNIPLAEEAVSEVKRDEKLFYSIYLLALSWSRSCYVRRRCWSAVFPFRIDLTPSSAGDSHIVDQRRVIDRRKHRHDQYGLHCYADCSGSASDNHCSL